jgi:hypothetical protein
MSLSNGEVIEQRTTREDDDGGELQIEDEEILERGLGDMPSLRDLTVRTLPQVPPRGVLPVIFNPSYSPL